MKRDNVIDILKKSFSDFYKNIILIVPTVILLVILLSFSVISVKINNMLNTNLLLTLWLIIFSLISLIFIAFFLSGLIGMSYESVRKKTKFGDMLRYSKRFGLKNFLIVLMILITYNAVRYIAHNVAFLIGKSFGLQANSALIIFFILYIAGLVGAIIFLTFSSFYLVIKNNGLLKSVMNSISLVKREYINTLSIILIFFLVNGILSFINNDIIIEIINTIFVIPYMALVLTRFVINFDKRK